MFLQQEVPDYTFENWLNGNRGKEKNVKEIKKTLGEKFSILSFMSSHKYE